MGSDRRDRIAEVPLAVRCHWMGDFLDVMRAIAAHVRAKEFASAERLFAQFIAKSRRDAARPVEPKRLEFSTPPSEVFDVRLSNALESRGYLSIGSLIGATDAELLAIPNIGAMALAEIRKVAPRPVKQTVHDFLDSK